jgi:hypothetical protein
MSVRVMGWVWDSSKSKANARLVLLAIADCASDDGGNAYPSMTELRRKTGLSERTVQAMINELVSIGEVSIARNAGPHGCNRYAVLMTPANPAGVSRRTPAESAPPQNLPPAESAVLRSDEAAQVNPPDPANLAPPQISHPPQNLHPEPKDKVKTLEPKNILSETASRPDVEQICTLLADRIEANGSRRPTITKAWRDAARLLIDRDGRPVEAITKAIDWCQADDFWRANVLSMPKLREQYDRLRLAASRAGTNGRRTNGHTPFVNPTTEDAYGGAL